MVPDVTRTLGKAGHNNFDGSQQQGVRRIRPPAHAGLCRKPTAIQWCVTLVLFLNASLLTNIISRCYSSSGAFDYCWGPSSALSGPLVADLLELYIPQRWLDGPRYHMGR